MKSNVVLLAVHRLRLLAVLGGLCWLMGAHAVLPLRLVVVAVVVDALADARPSRSRKTRWGGAR